MNGEMLGASPEELRSLSGDFVRAAQLLSEARAALTAKINGPLQWHGPDSFFFLHAWNSSHAPTLQRAVEMLQSTSRSLLDQAAKQEQTSAH
ncbi:hypothetical protein FHU41_002944 [Psychromicrobium silvestre]|uniref:WXG100 family type VII secretion target n=1 Tax=Psychromicrobium silvestre TaxID=1645614 RepID=A0A7Y9S8B8_9MICC|nr:hypothetical protein [Psychromicrobium silvestre]NYE96694.1 hypothetical protein [Psychromicrobium silvestre]